MYEFEDSSITLTGKYHPFIMDTPHRKYESTPKDYEKDMIMLCRQVLMRVNERIEVKDTNVHG